MFAALPRNTASYTTHKGQGRGTARSSLGELAQPADLTLKAGSVKRCLGTDEQRKGYERSDNEQRVEDV